MERLAFRHNFTLGTIDREAGIIYGVSVITVGEAEGHDCNIDLITLRQVQDCAMQFAGGLKVVDRHTKGSDSIFSTIGYLQNFRIQSGQLKADLHLLETDENRDKLMEMADKIPDTFGISISFSGPLEDREGKFYARCDEIYNAAVVDVPAANPTGLFSAKRKTQKLAAVDAGNKGTSTMNPEEFNKLFAAASGPMLEKLAALEGQLSKLAAPPAPSADASPAPPAKKGKGKSVPPAPVPPVKASADAGSPMPDETADETADDGDEDEDSPDDQDEEDDEDEDEEEDDLSALLLKQKHLAAKIEKTMAEKKLQKRLGKRVKAQQNMAKIMAREFAKALGVSAAVKPGPVAGAAPVASDKPEDLFAAAVKKNFSATKSKTRALELSIREQPVGYEKTILAKTDIKYS